MLIRILLGLAIGAVAGGLMGYWGKCSSGMCPLTATPLRGLLVGALLGGVIGLGTGRAVIGPDQDEAYAALPDISSIAEFDQRVLAGDTPVMVDFYQPNCPPCEQLAPVFAALAGDYNDRAGFVKVNVRSVPEVLHRYRLRATPTVILFNNGEVVEAWEGVKARSTYENALKAKLSKTDETEKETTQMSETPTVTMKGNPLELSGPLPAEGDNAPDATLVANDLSQVKLSDFFGKTLIVASVPSLDTSVCSLETKRFNEEAAKLGDDVRVLVVSMDLPFAQQRWCGAEGVENVTTLSDHHDAAFGKAWGVLMPGPRLLARAVFVIDADGKVRYRQLVEEVTNEPDYDDVLAAVRQIAGE
ncbi:MAG: thiol peroxidase [Phycisphaerae bacterium]